MQNQSTLFFHVFLRSLRIFYFLPMSFVSQRSGFNSSRVVILYEIIVLVSFANRTFWYNLLIAIPSPLIHYSCRVVWLGDPILVLLAFFLVMVWSALINYRIHADM